MTTNLFDVVNFDNCVKQTRHGATPPLLMEFPVNAELAPFLVSSMVSMQWVPNASQTGTIRAAVRKRQNIEAETVTSIIQMGQDARWGNIQDLTTEGVARCVEHVVSYDLAPVEILVAQDLNLEHVVLPREINVVAAPWLPPGTLVVLPVDRGFVGTLGTLGKHKAVAVCHNPSRGIAIAFPQVTNTLQDFHELGDMVKSGT